MKYLLFFFLFISTTASAQQYKDSLVTVLLPQTAALWIGKHIKNQFDWNNRLAPDGLKAYIGSGTNQDSLFSVTLKAGYITGMIELLLSSPAEVSTGDRTKIISNTPAIPGYTALATQIVNKANGNSTQKQVAIFIRDYYLERVAAFAALLAEEKQAVRAWANN